jgi:hypothetical protein
LVRKGAQMSKRLAVAVLVAIGLNLLATGYGAVAVGREAHALCTGDHGTVLHHECIRNGRALFAVPL